MDVARAQAAAFARVGSREQAPFRGQIPWNDGPDTAFAAAVQPLFALPARDSGLAWSIPVLDDEDQVTGLMIAAGGERQRTFWLPLESRGGRWNAIVDQLHRAPDTPAVLPRDTRVVRGAVRAVPLQGSVAYVQATYTWRSGGVPALERVHVFADGSVTTGPTLAAAGAGVPAGETAPPESPQSFRARVGVLYEDMRSALRRGDWSAFGRAYDELGDLIRATPP